MKHSIFSHISFAFCLSLATEFTGAIVVGQEVPQDPTIPTPRIREKLAPEPVPSISPTEAVSVDQPARLLPMASLPKIKIKTLILGTDGSGAAVLESEGETYTINLRREKFGKQVVIPKNQFEEPKPTADEEGTTDEQGTQINDSTNDTSEIMLLDPDTVQLGERFFTCISFTEQFIVFRDLFSGRLVLAK